jgi:UDP-MurNAc hydroxylase
MGFAMFKVTLISAACLIIETESAKILTDPWFTDGIYEGAWYKFPLVDNPIEIIGNVDAIYISHLHPDHFDPNFLKLYFEKYGNKPIYIPKYNNNILQKIGIGHGLTLIPTSFEEIGDISMAIFPQDFDDQDIDSAAVFSSHGAAFLNMNDCLYDGKQINLINSYLDNQCLSLVLGAFQYGPAGPYPHTFFECGPELRTIADNFKNFYIERFKSYIEVFKPVFAMPFAGSFVLGGKLAKLNDFMAKVDPYSLSLLDKCIVPLEEPGGFVDLLSGTISGKLNSPRDKKKYEERVEFVANKLLNYEFEFKINFDSINWNRLFRCAYANALAKKPDSGKYIIKISGYNESGGEIICIFSLDSTSPEISVVKNPSCSTQIFDEEFRLDYRHLYGLLTTFYQWNDAEVGSHIVARRKGEYNPKVFKFLNNFTLK